jgi:hypothetical protein
VWHRFDRAGTSHLNSTCGAFARHTGECAEGCGIAPWTTTRTARRDPPICSTYQGGRRQRAPNELAQGLRDSWPRNDDANSSVSEDSPIYSTYQRGRHQRKDPFRSRWDEREDGEHVYQNILCLSLVFRALRFSELRAQHTFSYLVLRL